ncbi:MAG TPA: hypothetical protein ENL45_02145 [Candidatus Woesearchaeota archaeon]|nr:hypothetical protein [Candidatus Woesearchaeota archaeon]
MLELAENNYRDELVKRIADCQIVISDLEKSPAWAVVVSDMQRQRELLDNTWQDIIDEKKLQKARELKLAVMHILSLKNKYAEELASLQKQLEENDNPEEIVSKDYDNETITEEG